MDESPPQTRGLAVPGRRGHQIFSILFKVAFKATKSLIQRSAAAAASDYDGDIYGASVPDVSEEAIADLEAVRSGGLLPINAGTVEFVRQKLNENVTKAVVDGRMDTALGRSLIMPASVSELFPCEAFNAAARKYYTGLASGADPDEMNPVVLALGIMQAARSAVPGYAHLLLEVFVDATWTTLPGVLVMALAYLRSRSADVIRFLDITVQSVSGPIRDYFARKLVNYSAPPSEIDLAMLKVNTRTDLFMCLVMAIAGSDEPYAQALPKYARFHFGEGRDDAVPPVTAVEELGLTAMFRALAGHLTAESQGELVTKKENPDSMTEMTEMTIDRGLKLLVLAARFDFSTTDWVATDNKRLIYSLSDADRLDVADVYQPLALAGMLFPHPFGLPTPEQLSADGRLVAERACHVVRRVLVALRDVGGLVLENVYTEAAWEDPSAPMSFYAAQDPIAAVVGVMFTGSSDSIPATDLFTTSVENPEVGSISTAKLYAALRDARILLENDDGHGIDDVLNFLALVDDKWPGLVTFSPAVPHACITTGGEVAVSSRLFGLDTYGPGIGADPTIGPLFDALIDDHVLPAVDEVEEEAIHFLMGTQPPEKELPRDMYFFSQVLGFMQSMAAMHLRYEPVEEVYPVWEAIESGDAVDPGNSVLLQGTAYDAALQLKKNLVAQMKGV